MAKARSKKVADKNRKVVTKFWKKSDKAIDAGIDSSIELGRKTEATGKKILSALHGESRQLAKKTLKTGKQLKKQSRKLQSEINLNPKSQASKKNLEILKKLSKLREQKILTAKEFNAKKKELLQKI
jgi:hypothetical protein